MDAFWIILGLAFGYVVVKLVSIFVEKADKEE
jgi:hypothetical protein